MEGEAGEGKKKGKEIFNHKIDNTKQNYDVNKNNTKLIAVSVAHS